MRKMMVMTNSHNCKKWQPRPEVQDAGQALVELGLTLPLLLLLLIGAAELGRLAYYSIEVSNAARAGVAYGAQHHVTALDFNGMKTAAQNAAGNVTLTTKTATNSCACSNSYSATSACSGTFSCSGANRVIEYVQMNTGVTISPMFRY